MLPANKSVKALHPSNKNPAGFQDIVRDNIALNCNTIASAGGSAAAQAFVWGETDVSELAPEWRTPDVIVAADVVYRRELFQPLLHALKSLGAMPHHPPFAAWRSGSSEAPQIKQRGPLQT